MILGLRLVYSAMARILVVDDDPSVLQLVRLTFERAGHTVMQAGSAMDALAALDGPTPPAAVVCDVLMPGMSGLQFYTQLVERAPQLRHRVVFLTAAHRQPDIYRPIEQLGVPMLGKVDDLKLVIDAVRVALLRPMPEGK